MTKQRAFLEQVLLPQFASQFKTTDKVVNVGAGYHPYRTYFSCKYITADKDDSSQEKYLVENIPYEDNSVDGLVFIGVFERADDPWQGVRELMRVLKPGGLLLFGAPSLGFEWSSDADRWRLTPPGLKLLFGEQIVESHNIDGVYLFAVVKKNGVQ